MPVQPASTDVGPASNTVPEAEGSFSRTTESQATLLLCLDFAGMRSESGGNGSRGVTARQDHFVGSRAPVAGASIRSRPRYRSTQCAVLSRIHDVRSRMPDRARTGSCGSPEGAIPRGHPATSGDRFRRPSLRRAEDRGHLAPRLATPFTLVYRCSKYTPKTAISAIFRGLRRGSQAGRLARQHIAAS